MKIVRFRFALLVIGVIVASRPLMIFEQLRDGLGPPDEIRMIGVNVGEFDPDEMRHLQTHP